MRKLSAALCLSLILSPISLYADFRLSKSTPLNSGDVSFPNGTASVFLASNIEGQAEPCILKAKNPVSGKDFELRFGSESASALGVDCSTSFVAFNSLGEAAFFNNSIFTYGDDSYLKPDKVNQVNFYSATGELQKSYSLPKAVSGYSTYYGLPYKQFSAAGLLVIPVFRQREVPESFKTIFNISLDSDAKNQVTADVTLAYVTKSSGVKIVDNTDLCGKVGCNELRVISVLDNGKVWVRGFRAVGTEDVESVFGSLDVQTGIFTASTVPQLGSYFEAPILESVNERGDMLFTASQVQNFDLISARTHVFLIDANTKIAQDLSCQIEYGDSANEGAVFRTEDSVQLQSVQRDFLNISNNDDYRYTQSFERSSTAVNATCARLKISFDPVCKKLMNSSTRSKLLKQSSTKAKKLKSKGHVCTGAVSAVTMTGEPLKGEFYSLHTYAEWEEIEGDELVGTIELKTYKQLKINSQGVAHFRFKAPSFAKDGFFAASIQGPGLSGVSNEQLNLSPAIQKGK